MRKIREIIRLRMDFKCSYAEISRSVLLGRSTVAECALRFEASGLSWPLPEVLTDSDLEQILYGKTGNQSATRPLPDFGEVHVELRKKGVTQQLLWAEYRQQNPDGMLLPLKDTPFYRDLQSTFDKISEKLAKTSRSYLDELQSEVIFEPGPRWGLGIDPDVVDVLRSACGERQQVEFSRGVAGGEATTKVVGPQFLYFAKGSLYFVAEDLKTKTLKTYSVPRIEAARLLEDLYESDVICWISPSLSHPISPSLSHPLSPGLNHLIS